LFASRRLRLASPLAAESISIATRRACRGQWLRLQVLHGPICKHLVRALELQAGRLTILGFGLDSLGILRWNHTPTTSPVFKLLVNAGGCPDEYDPSATYEEGDKVMLDDVTYKCRSWPNSAWCSVDVYAPGGVYSDIAWTTVGYCDGEPLFSADQNYTWPSRH
jgi:hypothetical protein